MPGPVYISAAVEGIVDEAVARRLIAQAGGVPGPVYGKNGKAHLRQKIKGYNNAARHSAWMVLVDLDSDADCAPPLRTEWLARPAPSLCFRVAVRAVEAWLIADAESLAAFLRVARGRIPSAPDGLNDPKAEMIIAARHSRSRSIRAVMSPRAGSGRRVGPAYASRLIEYVDSRWRPDVAAGRSQSLERAIACLRRLVEEAA